ncbi:ceramidase domain-containing protein [Flavobacterium aquicola]|uniref:Ceramidase n=1 Tax=Flavobacterium aquicola TaxID=1682742 RepID=A0A3E0DXF9_9FLAO|nr:ceramidase domain-containing protein [Flavobacterium aquicola]REG90754.1 ceramidase [Flavobacterium aquicola]
MQKVLFKIVCSIAIIAVVVVLFIQPISQNQGYHNFADKVNLFCVTNFWNVISNLPFVIIGFMGLWKTSKSFQGYALKNNFLFFFVGIFFTGFGSAWYHYNPNDATLVWDRLPMTISFMSFLSIIIGEFVDSDFGKKALPWFLSIGILSVVYWIIFHDLRFYLLIQFLPILLIIVILLLSKNNPASKKYFWLILLAYVLAKVLESFDIQIYKKTNELLSGHTLKHFAAAIASLVFYSFISKKNQILIKNAR